MASDINSVIIVGRLTRDGELKCTNAGMSVSRFSLASNRKVKKGDKWEDEASFIDCVLWGKSAETLTPYLEKGKQVCVQGELRQNRWEQDGVQKSRIEVVVTQLQLLGSSQSQSQQSEQSPMARQPVRSAQTAYSKPSTPPPRQASAAPRYRDPAPSDGPESFDQDEIPF
ncbi:MAG: single-stranded DNA-binding protein [Sphaerochaetaceae bacterium]